MDGIIIVNKPRGLTSRDVVNFICKKFNTKKVGHTGTLDPIAEGVLVICIGKATKLVELLTANDKEYIAKVKLGILTDTLDTDGKIIKESKINISKENLAKGINSFKKEYNQKVPIYSAVKINGKKLYEYARNNEVINLPSRLVKINDIKLIDYNKDSYSFVTSVSKGTYIRSLIRDINENLNIIGAMSSLIRTKQGVFDINDSYTLDDIKNDNYKILSITDILKNNDSIIVDDKLYNIVKNGGLIDNTYDKELVTFVYNDNVIAIYKTYEKDNSKMKPFKMFI